MTAKAFAWIGMVGATLTFLVMIAPLFSDIWVRAGIDTPTVVLNFFLASGMMVFVLIGMAGFHRLRAQRRGGSPHPGAPQR